MAAWLMGGSFRPIDPPWERVTATRLLHDFFPVNHTHVWRFAQGSPYYFFGTTWGGCAIGAGRYENPLCSMYESNPEFRAFLKSKLKDGSLNKSNLIALVSSPRTEAISPEQKQANELMDKFSGR
jgi:hypothetical protein